MGDYNIIVKNMLSGGTNAKSRLSAKHSTQRNKSTMNIAKNINKASSKGTSAMGSISSGTSGISLGKMGGMFKSGAVTASIITIANKAANFGISYKAAQTGNQLRAGNTKNSLDIVMSGGTSLIMKSIQNELFTKQTISRTNFGLDYGREIYNLNVEGSKYKRI